MHHVSAFETAEQAYLASCAGHSILDRSTELDLVEKSRAGSDAARRELVSSNRRLALKMAHENWSRNIPFMDRLSAAMEGLALAARSYDPEKGSFSYYAHQRIRERLQHQLCTNSLVSVPLRTAKAYYSPVSDKDSMGDVQGALSTAPLPEECLGKTLDLGSSVVEHVSLQKALRQLESRAYRVLKLRYGLDGNAPMKLQEVADCLDIGRSTASAIEQRALSVLRQYLSE